MSLEGKIQVQSDIVPTNDNPRMPVTDAQYVKGAPQVFNDIDELVAFHPNKMKKGNSATVLNWPSAGTITKFVLNTDPELLKDANGDSIITSSNFSQFWDIDSQVNVTQVRVRQYAPDGPGGGAPTYPYTLLSEPNWSNVLDFNKGHKWMRFRDDDIDDNSDGIFDNWSVPISILNAFQSGDFIDKRFKREGTPASFDTVHTGIGTLVEDVYYSVDSNAVEITGDLSLNDIGEQGSATSAVMTLGRVFKYKSANTYNFNYTGSGATVIKVIKTPARTIAGVANNEPAGWSDTPPGGTDQLWEISGQKSVYGQLKSEWILKRIIEQPEYTRYSNSASPHPDTIVDTNTSAADSSPGDIALEAAGWSKTYTDQNFIARRSDNSSPPPLFTSWLVEKISEESGEYIDRVFKLFDINLDPDSVILAAPVDRDPTREGWSDTPLEETDTQINYISEARKFFDGTLKTSWTKPIPYTGKDVFIDVIKSLLGDNFKYDQLGTVSPTAITLQADLYRGENKLWEQFGVTITYQWKKVYDGGAAVDISPTTNPLDDFYINPVTGSGVADAGGSSTVLNDAAGTFITKSVTAGDKIWNVTDGSFAIVEVVNSEIQLTTSALQGGADNTWASGDIYFLQVDNYFRYGQQVVIKPAAVDGHAIFRCTQTLSMAQAEDIVFEEEFSILDVTDGKDAKSVTVRADSQRFLYDSTNLVFSPTDLVLRAYQSNLVAPTFYWYVWSGSSWDLITSGVNNYTITGNILTSTAANRFTADGSGEELQYALSTHPTDPEAADYITTFSDFITISKLSAANIGVDGENSTLAILSNETHTVVLDAATEVPAAGEVAKATTRLSVFDGETQLDYSGLQFTVALGAGESTYFTVVQDPGDALSVKVSLINASWVAGVRSYEANLTITYGSIVLVKKFTLASTIDAPGAVLLDIDSDKGFEFTPTDKTNKTLTAKLYDTALSGDQLIPLPDAAYQFRWNVNGVWGSLSSSNFTRVVTQADIQSNSLVTVQVYIDGGVTLYRERTISMSDVVDARVYRAWTDSTSPGGDILTGQDPTSDFGGGSITVGAVTWRLQNSSYWSTHQPVYAQDAYVDPVSGDWVWTPTYRIQGEQGDQGGSGNFFFLLYKATERVQAAETTIAAFAAASGSYTFNKAAIIVLNDPSAQLYYYNGGTKTLVGSYSTSQISPDFGASGNTSSYAEMFTAGWRTGINIPATGIIWQTQRLWTGEGVTFDINGVPSTLPVSGSTWSVPSRLSGTDGRNFAGTNGVNGASPILAVVAGVNPGEKVLQLTGWIGTAPSPSHINEYLSGSGFDPNIANATVISGTPVELRHDSTTGYLQWKYTDEGAGSWRNLILLGLSEFGTGSFDFAGGAPGEVTISGVGSSLTSTVQGWASKPFRRRFKGFLESAGIRGTSSSVNWGRIDIQRSLNGGGYSTVIRLDNQYTAQSSGFLHTPQVGFSLEVPASNTVDFRIVVSTPNGGNIVIYKAAWKFHVELIPY